MIPNNNYWKKKSIESELEYSIARGGVVIKHKDFDYISNSFVNLGGDFNRVIKLKFKTFDSLLNRIKEIEKLYSVNQIYTSYNIDFSDDYNFSEKEIMQLGRNGYSFRNEIFLFAESEKYKEYSEFKIYTPSKIKSIEFIKAEQIRYNYYNEQEFEKIDIPLHQLFIKKFKPYWLMKDNIYIGSFYLAHIGNYCRLFSVEINKQYRKQGFGRILIECAKNIAYNLECKYLLLNSSVKNISFYNKCGFIECAKIGRLSK